MELGIGSTDWFAQIFTTKARRHKEKPETPPAQRLLFNREDREGREAGNRPKGGKIKLVGGGTTRTIAAKRDGTEASPSPPAAGPRIRGDCLRSFWIISDFSRWRLIGRASSQRGPEIGLRNAEISIGLMPSIAGWRTLCSCTKRWECQLGWGDRQNGQSFADLRKSACERWKLDDSQACF